MQPHLLPSRTLLAESLERHASVTTYSNHNPRVFLRFNRMLRTPFRIRNKLGRTRTVCFSLVATSRKRHFLCSPPITQAGSMLYTLYHRRHRRHLAGGPRGLFAKPFIGPGRRADNDLLAPTCDWGTIQLDCTASTDLGHLVLLRKAPVSAKTFSLCVCTKVL